MLKDGSNLLVHLRPAPVVLRVATLTARVRGDDWPYLEREVALVTWLASAGAAVMPPSDLVLPGPHRVDGWAMSAWGYVEHDAGVVPDAQTALAALDESHAALRGYPGELPLLNPVGDDLDRVLAFSVGEGLLEPDDASALTDRRDEFLARLLALAPDRQALHGDAFPRNSLVTPRGVVWIDFEDCCSGPAIWDLAVLARRDPDPVIIAEIRDRHGDEALQTAIALREIQADVWTLIHEARIARGW